MTDHAELPFDYDKFMAQFVLVECPLDCGWWQMRVPAKAKEAIEAHIRIRHQGVKQ